MNHSVGIKQPNSIVRLAKILETSRELAKKADGLRQRSEGLRKYSWQLRLESRKLNAAAVSEPAEAPSSVRSTKIGGSSV